MWRLRVRSGATVVPVTVDAHDGASVADLMVALAAHLGVDASTPLHCRRTGGRLEPGRALAGLGLVHGDELELAATPTGYAAGAGATASVAVVGGPGAGALHELPAGRHPIGRDARATIVLADREASRRHAEVVVGADGTVTVHDAGSVNGIAVDGRRDPGPVRLDDVVEVGGVLLAPPPRPDERAVIEPVGPCLVMNRPPRVTEPAVTTSRQLPAPPLAEQPRRLSKAATLAPLAAGVVGALLWSPAMLVLAVLSPVTLVWQHLEDRRGSRADHRRKVEAWRHEVDEAVAYRDARRAAELRRRRASWPDAATVRLRVRHRSSRLWERRPGDGDWCWIRLGWHDDEPLGGVTVADGGDPELTAWALQRIAAGATLATAPAAVPFVGLVGVTGPVAARDRAVRWWCAQAAALHSPRDLVVRAVLGPASATVHDTLAWLPHHESGPLPTSAVAPVGGIDAAGALLTALGAIVTARLRDREGASALPHLLVVLDATVPVPRSLLAPLLTTGAPGLTVLWLADVPASLPGECRLVVEVGDDGRATVTEPAAGRRSRLHLDDVDTAVTDEIAAGLAPLRDRAADGDASALPAMVSLAEAVGGVSADDVARRWARRSTALDAPIGVGAAGSLVIDLRSDGPHALVGGTTGAGKSELLQTWIGALAAHHPPTAVTFLLIDYKGGAAFHDAVQLPHTLGVVTDLDGHLAHRALRSLQAELRRRERLLAAHGAKDLLTLVHRQPDVAPPALVIVVDEFATLVHEIPDFVDGVVDIAQRGRSLGIHLVLATQRPAGAINDNVRANTNLRIALRMNDADDSSDVIGDGSAARLSRDRPGRAYVRRGHAQVDEVQIAYAGAHDGTGGQRAPVRVRTGVGATDDRTVRVDRDAATDLVRLVAACRSAAEAARYPRLAPPWLPPLPDAIALDALTVPTDASPWSVAVGLVDLPDEQRQGVHTWDLNSGGLVVVGGPGSGKTTALRTVAAAIATRWTPDEVHLYGIDGGTGALAGIGALAHCGGVVPLDDGERVVRLLRFVSGEVDRRRALLARHSVSDLDGLHRSGVAAPHRIVLLVDGLGPVHQALDTIDTADLADGLPTLVSEGRALGVHVVATVGRRGDVSMALLGAFTDRLVLPLTDPDDYLYLGLPHSVRSMARRAGRAVLPTGDEVQLATVTGSGDPDDQMRGLRALGTARPLAKAPHPVPPWPEAVVLADVLPGARASDGADGVVVGVGGSDLTAVRVPLDAAPLLVVGAPGSGRSSTLRTVEEAATRADPDVRIVRVDGDRSSVTVAGGAGRTDVELDTGQLADLLATSRGLLLTIDGPELIDDLDLVDALAAAQRDQRRTGLRIAVATTPTVASRGHDLVDATTGAVLLLTADEMVADLVGCRLPRKRPARPPVGRAWLLQHGTAEMVQVALASGPAREGRT